MHIVDVGTRKERRALEQKRACEVIVYFHCGRSDANRASSNDICSLNPKIDRLSMSALMEVDENGRVVAYELRESVIRSDERMTYTNVNKLLKQEDPQLAMRYADLIPLFRTMEELARVLIRMRERRGAIDFNYLKQSFEFDDEGRLASAEGRAQHRHIEALRLASGKRTVASHLDVLEVPTL